MESKISNDEIRLKIKRIMGTLNDRSLNFDHSNYFKFKITHLVLTFAVAIQYSKRIDNEYIPHDKEKLKKILQGLADLEIEVESLILKRETKETLASFEDLLKLASDEVENLKNIIDRVKV